MNYRLPGIRKIGWVDCRKLTAGLTEQAEAGLAPAVLTDIRPIALTGAAEGELRREASEPGVEKGRLTFACAEELPADIPLGFVVETVGGDRLLMGSLEHPRPRLAATRLTGTPGGDASAWAYEATHTARRTLYDCKCFS